MAGRKQDGNMGSRAGRNLLAESTGRANACVADGRRTRYSFDDMQTTKTSIRNAASLCEEIWWGGFLLRRDLLTLIGFSEFIHFDHLQPTNRYTCKPGR